MKDLAEAEPIWLKTMTPQLEFAFAAKVSVSSARSLGNLHGSGERLVMTVGGGLIEGPSIRGTILPGGTEWPLVRPDGVDSIDARYTFETSDGVLVNIRNTGYRVIPPELRKDIKSRVINAGDYYFRTWSMFEAPVGKYDWLTKNVFVGFGERHPEILHLWYYRVI